MTRCRCGHGRQWHRRGQGAKRQPCWAAHHTGLGRPIRRPTKSNGGLCRCRDFTPARCSAPRCDRDQGHTGYHHDRAQGQYWFAPVPNSTEDPR